ncbi:MAG: hypothetical protein Q4P13_08865 [Psychrobacter sp.]|nr:hypothetical protein [Psychrobacter sp.]
MTSIYVFASFFGIGSAPSSRPFVVTTVKDGDDNGGNSSSPAVLKVARYYG